MANNQHLDLIHKMEFPRGEAITLDVAAFDEAINNYGVEFVHWRAMSCPQGVTNKDDTTRNTHHDHRDCTNGYLYRRAGVLKMLFTGNGESRQFQDMGAYDGSTAQASARRFYDSDTKDFAYLSYGDRLYLREPTLLWPHWQYVQHDISGKDRLRYPAVKVEHLIDNDMREYHEGVDFKVQDGAIVWMEGRSPGIDPDSGNSDDARGRVYTAWYLFTPYWYVDHIGKAMRFVQAEDETGQRLATRMPMEVTLVRETQFEDRQKDDAEGKSNPRDMEEPEDGSFRGNSYGK